MRAPWLIDASGRPGLLARSRSLRAVDRFYPDMSVYGYFRRARRFPGEHAGNLLIEAVPWGWLWSIPCTRAISVGLVCDGSSRAALRADGPERYLRAVIDRSIVLRDLLAPAELAGEPIVTAQLWLREWPLRRPRLAARRRRRVVRRSDVGHGRGQRTDRRSAGGGRGRGRAERVLALVKFVYRVSHIHGDQPFWQLRHEWTTDASASAGAILNWLSRDPSIRYFRDAFAGMGPGRWRAGADRRRAGRRTRRDRDAAALLGDLGAWVPVLADGAHVRRGPGLCEGRIVQGAVAQAGEIEEFTGDACMAAALHLIDGQRTAREVVDAALAAGPAGAWLASPFQVAGGLVQAHDHGLLRTRAAVGR